MRKKNFREQQLDAVTSSRGLLVLFALTVTATVLAVNLLVELVWLVFGGLPKPAGFQLTNILVPLAMILGGYAFELASMKKGGAHVARLLGGQEVLRARPGAYRRLCNVVDEMAIASALRPPRIFVIDDEAINACAAGWEPRDSVVCVTTGALKRLSRDELQGVVAHEFSHIHKGDTRLNMRLAAMVFGLELLYGFGWQIVELSGGGRRRNIGLALIGYAVVAAGSVGWLAGRLLQAAVSRQREFLADASAVQFTRLPDGIGGALRKIAHQSGRTGVRLKLNARHGNLLAHMMLVEPHFIGSEWFSSHPKLSERLRRIFGRPVALVDSAELPVKEQVDPEPAAMA